MNTLARTIRRNDVQIQYWENRKVLFEQKQEPEHRKLDTDRAILGAIRADTPRRLAAFFPHGVSPTAQVGNAPLAMWAVDMGAEKVLASLIDQGMDVNLHDDTGKTLLIEAVVTAQPIIVKFLVLHGANVNATDQHGRTALMGTLGNLKNGGMAFNARAAAQYKKTTVRFLLKHGADVNLADERGWTPLISVVSRDDVVTSRLLLEHGANVNAIASDGFTPVMAAGGLEMLQLLLDKGANVNHAEKGVGTPLHWARKVKRTHLIPLLLKAGARDEAA